MSTLFPTSLDNKVKPTSSTTTNGPTDATYGNGHAAEHIFAVDSIQALEAKVGVNSSAVTTSHDYKLSHVTGSQVAASETYVANTITGFTGTATSSVAGTTKLSTNPATPGSPVALNSEEVSATTGVSKVVRANASGQIDAGFGGAAGTIATLNGSIKVVQDPANATATPTASKIPIADGSGKLDSWVTTPTKLQVPLVAGEALTAGNAVAIGTGAVTSNFLIQTSQNTGTSNLPAAATPWFGQTFTTTTAATITGGSIYAGVGGGTDWTATVSIRATSGGFPTGADIGGISVVTGTITGANAERTFTFGTPVPVSSDTVYALIVRGITYSGAAANQIFYQNTDVYAGGALTASADNGVTWAAFGGGLYDMYFKLSGALTVSGKVYKTTALVSSDLSNGFIGFANNTVSAAGTVNVNIGYDSNQSGLTPGSQYFLSDTRGAIATSAGSVSRKIGNALSATQILVKYDNV